MTRNLKLFAVSASLFAGALLLPSVAHAKKPGVLEGKPIVVDKLEHRKFRFQVTPQAAMSLSQPFVHKGLVGGKLRFDFTDWIGVRAMFQYGAINLDSKLLKSLNDGGLPEALNPGDEGYNGTLSGCVDGLPCRDVNELDNPAPLLNDFQAGLTRLQWQTSVDVAFTPFAGKLGMFSSIFTEYDLYVFGGLGLTSWERAYPDANSTTDIYTAAGAITSTDPNSDEYCDVTGAGAGENVECILHPAQAQDGIKVGGSFGAGLHLFITDWVSINLEVQDIVIRHNVGGLNATIRDVPPTIDNDDRTIVHNASFSIGPTFYFPPKPKRSKLKP